MLSKNDMKMILQSSEFLINGLSIKDTIKATMMSENIQTLDRMKVGLQCKFQQNLGYKIQ